MPFTKEKIYYYQIDALRSIMLLLGPVLHAGLSFMHYPLGNSWMYKHKETALFFDALILFIHIFRVPVFFVLAGFFMEMNLTSKPTRVILKKKLIRIGLPLVLGVLLLFPIVEFGMIRLSNHNFSMQDYWEYWRVSNYNTMHLWFLYYLMFFYLTHLFVNPFLIKIKENLSRIPQFRFLVILFFIVLMSWLLLNFINPKSFDGDYSLLPNIGSILYFLSFYLLGFILFHIKNFFAEVQKSYLIYLTVGMILFSLLLYSRSTAQDEDNLSYFENFFFVGAAYSFVLGFIGLTSKVFKKKSELVQYIAKSSYFVYVIHLPILVWELSIISLMKIGVGMMFVFLLACTLLVSYGLYFVIEKFKQKVRT